MRLKIIRVLIVYLVVPQLVVILVHLAMVKVKSCLLREGQYICHLLKCQNHTFAHLIVTTYCGSMEKVWLRDPRQHAPFVPRSDLGCLSRLPSGGA